MYDDTEAPSRGEGLPYRTWRPLPTKPAEKTGAAEDEYERFSEESNYDYISHPYETEEPKAPAEPPGPEIKAATDQSTFAPPQWKGCWRRHCTAVLLALVGVCLLMGIVLLSQHATILSELRKLNFNSTHGSCKLSTASLVMEELKMAFEAELRALEKHIENREASDRKVEEQISRIEEKLRVLQNTWDTGSGPLRWHKFKGSCYYFSETPEQWGNAKEFCAAADSHLIIINSKQEQDFLVMKMNVSVWLGLSDVEEESDWRWVDGSHPEEKYWRSGEPNNRGGGGEDCAALYKAGDWNDIPCDKEVYFVCEKRPESLRRLCL